MSAYNASLVRVVGADGFDVCGLLRVVVDGERVRMRAQGHRVCKGHSRSAKYGDGHDGDQRAERLVALHCETSCATSIGRSREQSGFKYWLGGRSIRRQSGLWRYCRKAGCGCTVLVMTFQPSSFGFPFRYWPPVAAAAN